ncbi:hypothetical protein BHE74_00042760 [Ensete ventricosum]|nr:hypothetical protein BHE74_00042760 [Ensete ventricosum]
MNEQGCRNGDSCFFSHDYTPCFAMTAASSLCLQEDASTLAYSLLELLPSRINDYVLILNDKDLCFSSNLSQWYDPHKIVATTHRPYSESELSSSGIKILWNIALPWQSILKAQEFPISWRQVKCVLWFADIKDDATGEHNLLQNFFHYLAVRMLADALYDMHVIITINNMKFALLQPASTPCCRTCDATFRAPFLLQAEAETPISSSAAILIVGFLLFARTHRQTPRPPPWLPLPLVRLGFFLL